MHEGDVDLQENMEKKKKKEKGLTWFLESNRYQMEDFNKGELNIQVLLLHFDTGRNFEKRKGYQNSCCKIPIP